MPHDIGRRILDVNGRKVNVRERNRMATLRDIREKRNLPFLKKGMKVYSGATSRFGIITGANASGNICECSRFYADKF